MGGFWGHLSQFPLLLCTSCISGSPSKSGGPLVEFFFLSFLLIGIKNKVYTLGGPALREGRPFHLRACSSRHDHALEFTLSIFSHFRGSPVPRGPKDVFSFTKSSSDVSRRDFQPRTTQHVEVWNQKQPPPIFMWQKIDHKAENSQKSKVSPLKVSVTNFELN